MQDDQLLGVVVVTVDLGAHEEGWRRARVKVVVTDSDDQVLLASEPNWRQKTLANLLAPGPDPSRVRRALRDARQSFGVALLRLHRRHAAPARRGAGRLPQLAAHLLRHASRTCAPG